MSNNKNLYIKPKIRLTLNGSKEHKLYITDLTYQDYEKESIDLLTLNLSPNSVIPNFGDKIELFMGREKYYFFGLFYVSTIKEKYLQGFSIEATSIDYTKGFKIKKNRSFENQSIKDILGIIARENNLKTRIDFAKQESIEIIEQVDESDGALCNRLANIYGCTFKVKNDTLVFIDQDKKFDRREYSLDAKDCNTLELEYFAKTHFNSVLVTYTDNQGEQRSILVGSGEPTYRSIQNFKSDTEALQWAQTRLKILNNQRMKGSLSTVGGVFFAGGYLNLTLRGKKEKFLIKQVTHSVSAQNWDCKILFE